MGQGFGEEMAKGLLMLLAMCVAVAFGLGVGCSRGCEYVRTHYTVKVERVEGKP